MNLPNRNDTGTYEVIPDPFRITIPPIHVEADINMSVFESLMNKLTAEKARADELERKVKDLKKLVTKRAIARHMGDSKPTGGRRVKR